MVMASLARAITVHECHDNTVCPATHLSRLARFAFRFLRSGRVLAARALVGRAPVQRQGYSRAQNDGDRAGEIICSKASWPRRRSPLFFSFAISSCSFSTLICCGEHASFRGTDTRRYQLGVFFAVAASPSLVFVAASRGSGRGSLSGAVSLSSADVDGESPAPATICGAKPSTGGRAAPPSSSCGGGAGGMICDQESRHLGALEVASPRDAPCPPSRLCLRCPRGCKVPALETSKSCWRRES